MNRDFHILIVDDEENARLYLANFINTLYPEFSIHFASSPVEAVFILKKEIIRILFLDVEMEGQTGLQMLEKFRDMLGHVPVIYVSGYKKPEFIQKAMRLNALDYLDKPVDPVELKCAVDKALNIIQNQTDKSDDNNTVPKICLQTEKGDLYFHPEDIICFESNKRYAIAHFLNSNKKVNVRANLLELSSVLPVKYFIRVSRQYIVNIQRIKYVSRSNKSVTLDDGSDQLVIFRVYPDFFKKFREPGLKNS